MAEIADTITEAVERAGDSRLNSMVALFVAITAVLMALCNIKDGNIVQAMSQSQSRAVDEWSHYQAKSTKQHLAEDMAANVEAQIALAPHLTPEARAKAEAVRARLLAEAATEAREKLAVQRTAQGHERDYDAWNVHDDQFDMADAMFSVAVALYGVTALTQRRWLFAMAVLATLTGAVLGLCGFMHWAFHPDWLSGLLG